MFGEQYGLERRLPIALQFVTFDADQREALKSGRALPANIETAMDAFHDRLTDAQQADPAFAYRVAFVPKLGGKASKADVAIEFVKPGTPEAEEISRVLLKEIEQALGILRRKLSSECRMKVIRDLRCTPIHASGRT